MSDCLHGSEAMVRNNLSRENTTRILITACLVSCLAGIAIAQESNRPRVFVTNSESWENSSTAAAGGILGGIFAGRSSGGARPQTAKIIKTFGERCPDTIVTVREDNADYIVILEHEGGKIPFQRDNKFVLINPNGEVVLSGSTRTLGNAVKDACQIIMREWTRAGRFTAQ